MFKISIHKTDSDVLRSKDILLILGDGRSLDNDKRIFSLLGVKYDVAAIGRSIKACSNPKHWFNADGQTAMAWAKQIKEQHKGTITHTLGDEDGFDVDWEIEQPDYHYAEITGEKGRLHGSSAFFATLAGLEMGYKKIVLAGCPLDTEGHWYFEPKDVETLGPMWLCLDFMAWLDFAGTANAIKVRSMSGYTQKILGSLTHGWLNEM